MDENILKFSNGNSIPVIGLGTWQVTDEEQLKETVIAALDYGYRHIDTAYFYQNEKIIGEILLEYFASKKLKRDDVHITSKLWVTFMENEEIIRHGVELSLANLAMDYIDLFLIHFPTAFKYMDDDPGLFFEAVNDLSCIIKTWKVLEDYVDKGKLKSIGVSNFNIEQMKRVKEVAKYPIASNQVEYHVFLQQPDLVEYCKNENIIITAYAPLGSPGRDWEQNWTNHPPMEDPIVKKIAQFYNKSEAQILLRFLIQRGICVIPKSVKLERVRENFNLFDFELSEEDMKLLQDLDKNERSFTISWAPGHVEYPF